MGILSKLSIRNPGCWVGQHAHAQYHASPTVHLVELLSSSPAPAVLADISPLLIFQLNSFKYHSTMVIKRVPLLQFPYSQKLVLISLQFTYQVRGKVQGVFFRVHTVNAAERYGISGYVQNLPREGTGPGDEQRVAGEAQGEEDALDKFFTEVKRGGFKRPY